MMDLSQLEFKLLKEHLYNTCGIDIPEEKSYLFRTRLSDLMIEEKFSSFNELYILLKSEGNGRLENRLIEVMTTHETSFFRDTHPFETFKQTLLPQAIERIRSASSLFPPKLCIWSAGCSTGQEPYSISMIINDVLENEKGFSFEKSSILASDISCEALTKARTGEYSKREIERGLDAYYRGKYFKKNGDQWLIDTKIRKTVLFEEINLSKQLSEKCGPFDFIFCRNVIIYFSEELKKRLIEYFYKILNPGGILLIGASENLYKVTDKFETEYAGPSIYYRKKK